MKDCINIGLLGVGTVGSSVLHVLEHNGGEIAKKAGCKIEIKKILVRNPQKAAELGKKYAVTGDFEDIVNDPDIDIVVELIGREHPAKEYIASALEYGKNVVTANKDVLAKYGRELFPLAELHNVDFMFEGAVGGGIPIIRPLKSCLAANRIKSVMGIVNGTTNYMLTKMSQDHMDYGEVLREAQEKGYAESDPTADVGGLDAARKLVILASIAFNTRISLDDVLVSGIETLKLCDIEYAKELGYTIKLLAVAKHDEEKGITVCVRPTMLPTEHPLAGVNDVFNAVFVEGDALGEAMFMGRGAGGLPTASAVCGDIIDVARNMVHGSTGRINCTCFDEKHLCRLEDMLSPFYIRLNVVDKPGVLAAIAAAFAAQNVGLKKVIQKQMVGDKLAELVVITYHVSELDMQMAVQTLKGLPVIKEVCSVIHVEDDNVE